MSEPLIVANISGGKDSVAMGLMLLERGERVDYFVFADTGMEYPECYDAVRRFEEVTGREVVRVHGRHTFMHEAADIIKRKRQEGRRAVGYGWPTFLRRWCTADLKADPIDRWLRSLGGDIVQCIGIAADEPKRLRDKPGRRYPLAEWGITEAQCLEYCRARGFFPSPCAYDHIGRMSCWCCPLANRQQVFYLLKHRPELWAKIKDMERAIGEPWKRGTAYYEAELAAIERQGELGL